MTSSDSGGEASDVEFAPNIWRSSFCADLAIDAEVKAVQR